MIDYVALNGLHKWNEKFQKCQSTETELGTAQEAMQAVLELGTEVNAFSDMLLHSVYVCLHPSFTESFANLSYSNRQE